MLVLVLVLVPVLVPVLMLVLLLEQLLAAVPHLVGLAVHHVAVAQCLEAPFAQPLQAVATTALALHQVAGAAPRRR